MCQNAAWDLVLAENWAESEGKRNPGDPFYLIFTFDKVLRQVAGELLAKPGDASILGVPSMSRLLHRSALAPQAPTLDLSS